MEAPLKSLWAYLSRAADSMPNVPVLELHDLCAACAEAESAPCDTRLIRHAIILLLNIGAVCHMSDDEKEALRSGKRISGSFLFVVYSDAHTMYLRIRSPKDLRAQLLLECDSLNEKLATPPSMLQPTNAEVIAALLGLTSVQIAQFTEHRSIEGQWSDLEGRDARFLADFWEWACRCRREDEKQRFLDFLSHLHHNELAVQKREIDHSEFKCRQARDRISQIRALLTSDLFAASSDQNSATAERIPIPIEVQREVWRRDQGRCVQCGSQLRLEFDHVIPVSRGGSNTVRNIQLLCESCNRAKSNNI